MAMILIHYFNVYFILFQSRLRLLTDLAGGLILSFDKPLDFHAITILLFAGVFISFVKEVIQSIFR